MSLSAAKKYVWKQVWRKCILMLRQKKQIKFDAIYFYLQIFTLLPLVPWSFEHQSLCREWTIARTKFNCVNPHTRPKQAWMPRNLYRIYFSFTLNRLISFLQVIPSNSNCTVGTKLSIEVVCGFLFTTLEFAKSFI